MTYVIEPISPYRLDLAAPLLVPIPAGCVLCPFATTVRDRYDQRLMTAIDTWMNSLPMMGEAALIPRNDGLIRIIYDLAGLTYGMRDRHDNSTIAASRSDVTMGHGGCALVIIEEKDGASIEEAKDDLKKNFQWIGQFDRLPYVIAFAITRTEIGIFAMTVDGSETVMRPLFNSDIVRQSDKWLCVIASINIARVLRYFIHERLFLRIQFNINEWHRRPHGKSVKMGLGYVDVKYEDQIEFRRLSTFYELAKDVPHMEKVIKFSSGTKKFRLVPLGIEAIPNDARELRSALVQILECITKLHLLNYCHCDIRWSNIVKSEGQWYLIDCTYATSLEDEPRLTSMPGIIQNAFVFNMAKWSPRHDYYQIGLLLSNWASTGVAPLLFQALSEYFLDRALAEVNTVVLNAMMKTLAESDL